MSRISRRNFIETAGLAAAIPALGTAAPQSRETQGTVTAERDVVFGKGGGMDLRLDIYKPPAGTEKRMATIHFHGGGFTSGSKETLEQRIRPYAALGYVAIAAQYRLAGQSKYPGLVHDAKAAIRWVRANATRLGIDPKRIGVVGYSAGAYMALFTAGTARHPEFEGDGGNPGAGSEAAVCIGYYPAPDITAALVPEGMDPAARAAAASTAYLSEFPPTLLFHGVADTTIRIEGTQRLFQQLRDAKVPAEFHAFEGVPHVFDEHPEFAEACARLADLFIDRHVIRPRTYPPFQPGGARGGRGA